MWFAKKQEVQVQQPEIIDYKWLEEATRNGHTPDIADLNNREGAVVFVYNDLMKKHRDHHKLNPVVFGGDAYTLENFNGWYRKSDRAPIMLHPFIKETKPVWSLQTAAHSAPFKGELFVISISTLKELDKLYANGVEFIRRRIEVHVPYEHDLWNEDGTITFRSGLFHHYIKAWCYVGNPDYFWSGVNGINNYEYEPMDIFTPRNLNVPWKGCYYYHPVKEQYVRK